MKKLSHSLWFRFAAICTLTTLLSFTLVGLCLAVFFFAHPSHPSRLFGIKIMILICISLSTLNVVIGFFASQIGVKPFHQLSDAFVQVSKGDYTTSLSSDPYRGELHILIDNFNLMVQELNNTTLLRSDFIANVSHEFKSPLAVIQNCTALLAEEDLPAEERREYLEIIHENTQALSNMTSSLLQLSQLEHQTVLRTCSSFRLDEQIRRSILDLEQLWTAKDLHVEPELQEIVWSGAPELTGHIWKNLLDNAIKFTPPGGTIRITARDGHSHIIVQVQDSGIGMTEDVQKHIFDKFYQGDRSHQKAGNGLGLALVQQIVLLHGGSIQTESAPGRGSSFTILLPVSPEPHHA